MGAAAHTAAWHVQHFGNVEFRLRPLLQLHEKGVQVTGAVLPACPPGRDPRAWWKPGPEHGTTAAESS